MVDADVDAAFFLAVRDVLATLVPHRLDGDVAAARGGVVLPLVAGLEALCCFLVRPEGAQAQFDAFDLGHETPRVLLLLHGSSSLTPAASSFRRLLLDELPLREVGPDRRRPLLGVVGVPAYTRASTACGPPTRPSRPARGRPAYMY